MESSITLNPIGTFETGIFDESAAEIPAFDPISQSLFVVNGDSDAIDVLDISDPTHPTLTNVIDVSAFGAGPNSVAVSNGIVAIAVENEDDTAPGTVTFFDADGTFLNAVTVGILPDALTFTPDGSRVVVANEGEAVGDDDDLLLVDPEGSISIIDLSNGVDSATVATADFSAFNGREDDLRGDGVRIFPGRSAAEDLEPEFVAISPDGATAFVTLQENNALAAVDLESATVVDVLPLGVVDFSQGLPELETFSIPDLTTEAFQTGTDPDDGSPIFLGGLSGLVFDGVNPETGNPQFLAVNDRGPVGGLIATDDPDSSDRPFLTPDLQIQVLTLELNEAAGEVSVVDRIGLSRVEDGESIPITGLTNIPGFFEVPLDAATGEVLENDPFGIDAEGIVRLPNGNIFIADEQAPSISVFSPEGVLIDRFVPAGFAAQDETGSPPGTFGSETLPAVYLNRRNNRGFEGIAFDDERGIVYAFVQTPFTNPDIDTSNGSSILRILGIDPETGIPVEEFVYVLQTPALVTSVPGTSFGSAEIDRIGDAVFAGDGRFFLIERDNEAVDTAQQFVVQIDLTGATNILGTDISNATDGVTLEQLTPDELIDLGIQPVNRLQLANLPSLGFSPSEQSEGLALLDDGRLAVLNDNDSEAPDIATELGIISFTGSNGLDPSDEDGGINIGNFPVFGLFQPDAIASFEVDGATFFVTANEGDNRDSLEDLTDVNRVEDLVLDPTSFPDADTLQLPENLGRLEVSTIDGDLDGDGDFDQLFAFGTRSFSIRDELGNLVFDSGDFFEQLTADLFPENFNADNDENDFDSRSDDAGPEPEGVAVGVIGDDPFAFIGLERIGGVAAFNVSDPSNPEFVDFINNRDFSGDPEAGTALDLGPEGLVFIAAEDSPNSQPLLAVGNEVSGTTTLFEITPEFTGTADDDLLEGTISDDLIAGLDGDDTLLGAAGDDTLDGGEGTDTASFIDSAFGVTADLSTGTAGFTVAEDGGIAFLGEIDFETGFTFGGLEVGGLSGIEFNPDNDTFLAISDTGSFPQRFFTLDFDFSVDAAGVASFDGVEFLATTTLLDFGPAVFVDGTVDPESIRIGPSSVTPGELSLFITSEGSDFTFDAAGEFTGTLPFVREISFAGESLFEFELPEGFEPTADESSGVRDNLVFESLTFSPDGEFLFTATENALFQDGDIATLEAGSPSRIVQFDVETGEAVGQFVFVTQPIPEAPIPPDAFADHGLVELIALSDTQFIALERSFAVGVGNTIKVLLADISEATDVSGPEGIGDDFVPAATTLLFDVADFGVDPDNIEGITFGPTLENGQRTLILVSDNNFSDSQITQILAFTLDGEVELITEADTLISIENLAGSTFDDSLLGDAGDNVLDGDDGNDLLVGGAGNDTLIGGLGDDTLQSGGGVDVVDGGEGTDTAVFSDIPFALNADLTIGEAAYINGAGVLIIDELIDIENLVGNDFDNELVGDASANVLSGADGADTLAGGLGDDEIFGDDGADTLRGDLNDSSPGGTIGGNDTISGGAGDDAIGGKAGDDSLLGGIGDDTLFGDDGDDILQGGLGNDVLTGDDFSGGTGSDTFVLAIGEGTDTITDFQVDVDFIGLAAGLSFGQLSISQDGDNALIGFELETLAIVNSVLSTDLTEAAFSVI
ncbi:MAG: hypothetical protein F6K19_28690 [Cyanothece sp. SIO1E1]|nr:hypothetical protein [Cyanothece sp. SIO1E1]